MEGGGQANVSCLYLISQMFPRPWGCRTWRNPVETWGLELNALVRQMMAFLIRPSFLSRLSPCGSHPAFPMFYTDTISSSISHSMGLPPGHCSHCSFFHPSLFSTWWPLQVSAQTAPPLWNCSRFPRRPSSCLVHPVPSIMASVQCTVCFCMPDSNYTMSNLRAVFILIALLFSSW